MGVTLHYTATLKSSDLLPGLINEMEDLSEEAGWKATRIGPEKVKLPDLPEVQAEGMLLHIQEKMEPVNLIFDQTGQMINFIVLPSFNVFPSPQSSDHLEIAEISGNGEIETKRHPINFKMIAKWSGTKTQFAGPYAHICLCKLLRYLEKAYFSAIEVRDEGNYWHSEDLGVLTDRMNLINAAIDDLDLYLQTHFDPGSASEGELLRKLAEFAKMLEQKRPKR